MSDLVHSCYGFLNITGFNIKFLAHGSLCHSGSQFIGNSMSKHVGYGGTIDFYILVEIAI